MKIIIYIIKTWTINQRFPFKISQYHRPKIYKWSHPSLTTNKLFAWPHATGQAFSKILILPLYYSHKRRNGAWPNMNSSPSSFGLCRILIKHYVDHAVREMCVCMSVLLIMEAINYNPCVRAVINARESGNGRHWILSTDKSGSGIFGRRVHGLCNFPSAVSDVTNAPILDQRHPAKLYSDKASGFYLCREKPCVFQ